MNTNTINTLKDLHCKAEELIRSLHDLGRMPHQNRQLHKFSKEKCAKMVGRSVSAIKEVESELIDRVKNEGFTLQQINTLREHFGTLPRQRFNLSPLTVCTASLKGGSSKTSTTVNFAQYLGLQGYRVLVIDMDSQSTLTSAFAIQPNFELDGSDTALPFLNGQKDSLSYAIRSTHFHNIDIIPSCIELYHAEIGASALLTNMEEQEELNNFFLKLKTGIDGIKSQYDIILIDTPPSLGVVQMSCILSSDSLIIPLSSEMYDFDATSQFIGAICNYIESFNPDQNLYFIKFILTKFDQREVAQQVYSEKISEIFGKFLCENKFFRSAEIGKCNAVFQTPYEQKKQDKRIVENMNNLFKELEEQIILASQKINGGV